MQSGRDCSLSLFSLRPFSPAPSSTPLRTLLTPAPRAHSPFPPSLQLWSEACNLRHCPEAVWFLYYTLALSPGMEQVWDDAVSAAQEEYSRRPSSSAMGLRDTRLTMRNLMQVRGAGGKGWDAPNVCRLRATPFSPLSRPPHHLSCSQSKSTLASPPANLLSGPPHCLSFSPSKHGQADTASLSAHSTAHLPPFSLTPRPTLHLFSRSCATAPGCCPLSSVQRCVAL